MERTEVNGGIIPSNIGLDGVIGGACAGKWYGGVYGWAHSTLDPGTGSIRHRPFFHGRAPWGFGNALLLTGDQRYVDVWRGVIDRVNEKRKVVDGKTMYPRMHGDDGWYDYRLEKFLDGALEVYYWSMDPADLERLPTDGWLAYLQGLDPDWPTVALQQEIEAVRQRVEGIRRDTSTPDTRLSDDMNGLNPAMTDTLTQLMLGGLPTGHSGYPLHCRVRYFDPERRRAGLPEDVAALVEKLTGEEATLTLLNVDHVQ